MSRWSRSPSALLTAAAIGAAVFGVLAFGFAAGPCGVTGWSSLGVAITSGMLIGVTALVLLGSRPLGADEGEVYQGTPCASCGAALADEWRLCPHCGQMLECDTRHPAETVEKYRT